MKKNLAIKGHATQKITRNVKNFYDYMKKIIIIFVASLVLSCAPNSGIHETVYRVDFFDGTTAFAVGYTVTTINDVYVVKSISNNSIFDASQVRGIYPKETGTVWNPYKKSLKE